MLGSDAEGIDNWILVTGVMRSGTTFVGKILTLPLQADYIHEPFNGGYSLPDRKSFEPRYFRPGASHPDARAYRKRLEHIFRYDFGLEKWWHPDDPWWRKAAKMVVGSRGPFYLRLAKLNPFHTSAILKSPLAVRPAEFLYDRFDVQPVVVVRHPTSLAASFKRVGWWPEVKDFRNEPELVEDYLADETDLLERSWPSRFLESMGHWKAANKILLAQAEKYADWIVVTHEELSARPVPTFKRLYDRLGLPWSTSVKSTVERLTQSSNSAKADHGQPMDLSRDSADIFQMRRDSLSLEERQAIFEVVKEVALQIYSRESFNID
jgi:hypothetical protein